MGGRPIERADIVVKFVKGRSTIELGRKMRTKLGDAHQSGGRGQSARVFRSGTILIQVIAKGYQTFGQTFEVDGAREDHPH
jgi:hypothetical protein